MMTAMDVVGWPVVAASLSLVVLAIALGRWLRLRVERDLVIATVRAAVQLLAVGVLFTVIIDSSLASWWAAAWVAAMVVIAAVVVRRRARHRIRHLAAATMVTITATTLIGLGVTFGFGVLDYEPVSLLVIAGITIGNTVPSAVLAVDQSVNACRDRVGEIEAALALGLDRGNVAGFVAPRAARSTLIPQVERTKVVGIIALPGAMTGLLLAGVDPVDAVVLQLLVMYLVLGSVAISAVVLVAVVTRQAVGDDLRVAPWVLAQGTS